VWITRPDLSFGSNQVVLGGMMLPVLAMSMICFFSRLFLSDVGKNRTFAKNRLICQVRLYLLNQEIIDKYLRFVESKNIGNYA